jgi:ACS family D-galactonate transporter-like MFS transporter
MYSPGNRKAWAVVALVFLFMLVNFADKAVVGLSSVPIMSDLGLTYAQFGELGSAFFLLFSLSGVAVGFLANRVRAKALMLGMALVWACTLLPMTWVSNFGLLLLSRVILGAAEGPAFPVAIHAVYKWFADRQRALPTSIVACGAAFGTGVIAPLITWIIVNYGWHTAFGALGVAGLAWACLWFAVAEEGPMDRVAASEPDTLLRVPYRQLLLSRTAIGVFLGGFGAYWVIALNITWLASYLIKSLHIAPLRAGWIIGLPSVMQMILAPGLGLLSQFLTRRGLSSRVTRGLLGALCVVAAGGSMICMVLWKIGILKVFLIGLSFSIGSVIFTLGSTLIGEITPESQRGAMLGITNSIHTLAGLCAPIAMGLVVDVSVNPEAGLRSGYLYSGALITTLGLLAAILIDPQTDLARFRQSRATGSSTVSTSAN